MENVILAGDVDVGDVIVLPGADEPVLVSRVRLGQGGLIFTVAPASGDAPEEERPVKLTAEVRLHRRGRDLVLVPNGPGVTPQRRPGRCRGGPRGSGCAPLATVVRACRRGAARRLVRLDRRCSHGQEGGAMSQDRQWVIDLLRRLGYTRAAEEAARELPDPVTMEEIKKFGDRHGISHDDIMSEMGGSP